MGTIGRHCITRPAETDQVSGFGGARLHGRHGADRTKVTERTIWCVAEWSDDSLPFSSSGNSADRRQLSSLSALAPPSQQSSLAPAHRRRALAARLQSSSNVAPAAFAVGSNPPSSPESKRASDHTRQP